EPQTLDESDETDRRLDVEALAAREQRRVVARLLGAGARRKRRQRHRPLDGMRLLGRHTATASHERLDTPLQCGDPNDLVEDLSLKPPQLREIDRELGRKRAQLLLVGLAAGAEQKLGVRPAS